MTTDSHTIRCGKCGKDIRVGLPSKMPDYSMPGICLECFTGHDKSPNPPKEQTLVYFLGDSPDKPYIFDKEFEEIELQIFWTGTQYLAPALLHYFPKGAHTVWNKDYLIAAFPADLEQHTTLEALGQEDGKEDEFLAYADELCAPYGRDKLRNTFEFEQKAFIKKQQLPVGARN